MAQTVSLQQTCRYIYKLKLIVKVNGEYNSSLSYGASPAIWDHTVLPATGHKSTRPALTPASKLVLDLPTPEGWKAELTYRYKYGANK